MHAASIPYVYIRAICTYSTQPTKSGAPPHHAWDVLVRCLSMAQLPVEAVAPSEGMPDIADAPRAEVAGSDAPDLDT